MKIQEEYSKKAGRVDKGVHRQSIWVLWRTSMPSILTEIGYLTNPLEEQFLGSEKGQDYLAKALFRGLRRYKDEVEGAKKEYNDEFENLAPLENENIRAGNLSGQKKADDEDAGVTLNNAGDSVVPVPAGNGTIPQKDSNPPRQKINDSKYVDIPLNPPDNDTALTAKDIANRYKKDQQRSASGPSVKTNTIEIRNTTGLVFKVQFASSDVALNLKQERFSAITDADFYKTDNVLKYTSGKFASIKDATAHQLYLREKGFKDCFIIAVLNGKRIDMAEARKMTGQ
jgi:N-acetylmuramoyl-L-alanine amidase